jgi:small subunit ribosomal protein S8
MPVSKLKIEVARILAENHFIHEYYTEDGRPVIRFLERASRPGLRRYVGADDVPKVLSGMGIAILSTSRGVMTGRDARAARIGGELLATVY